MLTFLWEGIYTSIYDIIEGKHSVAIKIEGKTERK